MAFVLRCSRGGLVIFTARIDETRRSRRISNARRVSAWRSTFETKIRTEYATSRHAHCNNIANLRPYLGFVSRTPNVRRNCASKGGLTVLLSDACARFNDVNTPLPFTRRELSRVPSRIRKSTFDPSSIGVFGSSCTVCTYTCKTFSRSYEKRCFRSTNTIGILVGRYFTKLMEQ